MLKKSTTPKVDYSQDSILRLLRPDDNWTNRQVWIASVLRVGSDPVVQLDRDGWQYVTDGTIAGD